MCGQPVASADIPRPESVTLVTDGDVQLVSLMAPQLTLEEEDAIAEGEGADVDEADAAETTEEGAEGDSEGAEG